MTNALERPVRPAHYPSLAEVSRSDRRIGERRDGYMMPGAQRNADVAVLIPCHNEALSIADVVQNFRNVLPAAKIYVYDNCSTDDTRNVASAAGAIVRSEPWPGRVMSCVACLPI